MIKLLTKFVERIVRRIEIFYRFKYHPEWDETKEDGPSKVSYQWKEPLATKKLREQEEKVEKAHKEGRYRRHKRSGMELELKTERVKPGAPLKKGKIARFKNYLKRKKKTFLAMAGITFSLAFLKFFWAPIAILFLRLALGTDCGYRKALFEPYKKCGCVGKSFQVKGLWERATFCLGQCYECHCWQIRIPVGGEEGKASEIYVRCPEEIEEEDKFDIGTFLEKADPEEAEVEKIKVE